MSINIADIYLMLMNNPHEFKRHIDDLPDGKALLFDGCEVPNCVPNKVTLALYKEKGKYTIRLASKVGYTGWNPAILALADGKPITFKDFLMLRRFFEEIATGAEALPNVSTGILSKDKGELSEITDFATLSMPAGEAQPLLDYKALQHELGKRVIGQDVALEKIAYQTTLHYNKKTPTKPSSFYLFGDSGVGKSEAAKAVAKAMTKLTPHVHTEVWTDCNQLTEAHNVNRLRGSEAGYVGYDDVPILEAVTRNPYSVFIWDEADKCHPDVLQLMMAILDEGRCTARKELPDHSRYYDFRYATFIFTSNLHLNESPKKQIGFAAADTIKSIHHKDCAVEISYHEEDPVVGSVDITQRIYRETEAAREKFMESGVLREIASRFGCFVEFKKLSDEAKIRILAKQVLDCAAEFGVQLAYISPGIMQALINATMSEDASTVRSYKNVIDGYLAADFAAAGTIGEGPPFRLEGSIEAPKIMRE